MKINWSPISLEKKIQFNSENSLQFVFITYTTQILKVLKSHLHFVKAIFVELLHEDKYILCIWISRFLNEEQNKIGMKKKMMSVGVENNSGQSFLKNLSQCLTNSMWLEHEELFFFLELWHIKLVFLERMMLVVLWW